MNHLLEVEGLCKSFGENMAVKDLSFYLNEGEIVGFLGPNGAGKSTTIHMIATIVDADAGHVIYAGKKVTDHERSFKQALGLVPQEIAVFSDLTAYNNVKFFGSLYGLKGSTLRERTREALEFVGLWNRKDDYPDTFSGGMKRRLNMACSIVHKPKLLIMDEPTVGIDPQSRNNILELTRKLCEEEGTTVVYTSHYMEEAQALCSRIIIVDKGQIIEQGNTEELKAKYAAEGLKDLEAIFLHLTGKTLRD